MRRINYTWLAIGIVVGAILLWIVAVASAVPAPKVTICHHTGSQTNPTVTITVSENAVAAHIKNHGDTSGACQAGDVPVDVPDEPTTPQATPTAPVAPTGSPDVIGDGEIGK